tara:strand:+ start:4409 stop:4600 length:192 start_codon:yes stop_codon:yes gene_type:complete
MVTKQELKEKVMAMLQDDEKMTELVSNRSQLYTAYGVKDKDGKFRGVIDIDSVVELLRDILGN